jgi:hypothetical protein
MRTVLMMVMPLVLALLSTTRPGRGRLECVEEFLLRRIEEEERSAISDGVTAAERDRIISTARARRKFVAFYRCSKDRPQGAAYLLVIRVLAELYSHHPDYNDNWRPGVPDTYMAPSSNVPGSVPPS